MSTTTRHGQLKGKLAYMAPEQARGNGEIDRRADVFAAGIVLWEVLTGRRLFRGDGEVDTLKKVMHLPIPPVRAVAPTVPAVLEAVVAKALQRDPDRRLASAAELGEALERSGRLLGLLGTARDVAAHVDTVLGAELKHEREAVCAWMARSEPRQRVLEPAEHTTTGGMARTATSAPPTPSTPPRSPGTGTQPFSWGWTTAALGAFAAIGVTAFGFRTGEDDARALQAVPDDQVLATVAPDPPLSQDDPTAVGGELDGGGPDAGPQSAYR
jgi:serine/threonine-protein kinase